MPREMTLQSPDRLSRTGALAFTIDQRDTAVWVTLSGVMDREGLARVVRRVDPLLTGRSRRVVLDGARLLHVDYRAVRDLVGWNDHLKPYAHQLRLARWSRYRHVILSMEDWSGELNPRFS
jgi:hypothetical protein